MKKKKIIKLINYAFIFTLILGLTIGTVSFIRVNKKFPSAEKTVFKSSETATMFNSEIKIKSVSIERLSEFTEQNSFEHIPIDNQVAKMYDIQIITVNLSVSNRNECSIECPPIPYFVIECGAYSNGIDADLFALCNSEESITKKLLPGEERDITLVYSIYSTLLPSYDGNILPLGSFNLVLSVYPKKTVISFI